MIKNIMKLFKKQEEEVRKTHVLKKIVDNRFTFNPFEHYAKNNKWETGGFYKFQLSCPENVLKKYTDGVVTLFHIEDYTDVSSGSLWCKVLKSEYDNTYTKNERELACKIVDKVNELLSYYNNLDYIKKEEFDYTYYQSLEAVEDFLRKRSYIVDYNEVNYLNKIINLIQSNVKKDLEKQESKDIDNLKFEIDYLENIKKQNSFEERLQTLEGTALEK